MNTPTTVSGPIECSFLLYTALLVLLLASCDKPKIVNLESPKEPETQQAPAVPTPQATPTPVIQVPIAQPSPQTRSCPEGTLFVIKRFSVTTTDGLHGFPAGKKVKLIREEQDEYVVTDDVIEGKAPKTSFTNDLDVADAINNKQQQAQQAAQLKLNEQQKTASEEKAVSDKNAQSDIEARNKEKKIKQISAIEVQLEELKRRISKARNERSSKGFPADGGPRYNNHHHYYYNGSYHSSGTAVSLSSDASQIEQLLSAQIDLESRLRLLKKQ